MVWGSLHISSISLDAVGERYPAPRARRCPWAMIGPRGWKGKADQSLTRPDSAARRGQVGRWRARSGLNPDCSGEARASFTADYPRRGKPSPLLALPIWKGQVP